MISILPKVNKLMLAIGLTCICLLTHAQDNPKRDSLWMILQNSQQDTIKVLNLLLYGEQYEISDPDSAMYYYKIAKSLSEKIGYKKGLSSYTGYTIAILNNQGKFREALELCKENAQLWEGSENKQELAAAYINLGSEWQYLSDFQTAAENYLKALSFAEAIQHLPYQRVAYNNLASLFNSLQQYDKGRSYAQRSLDIAIALKNEYGIASSLINLGNAENSLKIFDSSLSRFLQVEALGNKMEDQVITMDGWLGIAETYTLQQRWNEAEPYLLKTFTLSKSIETNEYQLYACMGLGDLYIRTKQYGKADIYLQTGTDLAKALGTRLELKDLYFKKAELQEAKGETAEALLWYKKFVLLDDSLTNEKINNNINLGEIKYETDKKELQIENLEAQRKLQQLTIKQQNTFNWVLGGSALSILFIALLGWRNFRQKQLLQKQQIIDLEKEKQLLATESMLKGQEEERSRLAKDLHDGLGGMLSGVKFSFSNLKETMHMEQQDMKSFERNIDLLDSSIKELRRVAHSMMPEVLIKYGLDAALRDYCTFINTSGIIKVIYQSHGLENIGTNQTVNVTIYRVIQE
ncbi:MAG: histidine kinase, partial [Sphingobacteriales bacterium]